MPRDVLKAHGARKGHRPDRRAAALHPADAAGMAGRRSTSTCATSPTPAAACRARPWMRCAPRVPAAKPFLMYGLTEAFRSTYLPPERGGPPARFDRQGDSECRDPGAARGRQRMCGRRAGRTGAPRRAGRPGLLERCREDGRALQAAAGGHCRSAGGPAIARVRGVFRRHGAPGCRRLSLLHRPPRRDDEDLGLPGQPDRGRGDSLRHQAGRRVRGLWRRSPDAWARRSRSSPPRPAGATELDLPALLADCRQRMPAYMVPAGIEVQAGPLPRNPNGKIDRKLLSTAWVEKQQA